MNLSPSAELSAYLDTLEKVLERAGHEADLGKRPLFDAGFDSTIEESGLLEAAAMEDFGPLAAAMLIERIARVPKVAELGASALIRPSLCAEWPRPVAILDTDARRMARFLPQAGTVLFGIDEHVRAYRVESGDCEDGAGFFAYPMGHLVDPDVCFKKSTRMGLTSELRRLLAVATACEIAGALRGGLEAVTEHVRNRRQFGRTLGSFQIVRHRLAGSAADISAMRLLAFKAAQTGEPSDAQIALGYAQDRAGRVVGDLHQFMGATGLTLDHPLFIWTYRVKLLLSECGGPHRQYLGFAKSVWSKRVQDGSANAAKIPERAAAGS